ncbi:MAG: gliding motility-associated C-terminal domain-containing protein [Saprospiraceae bacterium]|nr:gliding motility-associated C-terminal domain-containing protein [Candidatus Defluviibacterium haderslevense]
MKISNRYFLRLILGTIIFQFFSSKSVLAQLKCCCGAAMEIDLPGLDFEFDPYPLPLGFIPYTAVSSFGPWIVTQGAVDHGDKDYCGGLSSGNPNGPSTFMDLYGSPPTGGAAGTVIYPLTGLIPGNTYYIEFWYATFTANGNFSANLKIENGSWLNVSWTANNPGNVVWLKKTYSFIAKATTSVLSFTDTGSSSSIIQIGMLLDDIKIFSCPGDQEGPMVNNPPEDTEVSCDKEIPIIPILTFSDNCDINPKVSFTEKIEIINPCYKKLTRTWRMEDACGNINNEEQIIDIIDKNPPQYIKLPESKMVYCEEDVTKEFNDWIKLNGNAIAIDECDKVSWRQVINHTLNKSCDSVKVDFIATDQCGQENQESAYFIVRDTIIPKFVIRPQDKNIVCKPNKLDSLNVWLQSYGNSRTGKDCDTVIMRYQYDGDITKNPIQVMFYTSDRCGNIDSSIASFSYRAGNDTFQITDYSCSYIKNSKDTIIYSTNECDSIVIIDRIKRNSDSVVLIRMTCDSSQKILDTLRLTNVYGCDSIIFLQYKIEAKHQNIIKKYDCELTQYKTDTIILQGQFCDSLSITEQIPLRRDSVKIERISCDKSMEGTTTNHFINNLGCDSIVVINTIYRAQQITRLVKQECGLLQSYIDTNKIVTANCDSLIITDHIGIPLDSTRIDGLTCDTNKVGVFIKKLINRLGCDSIVIETKQLAKTNYINIAKTTCKLSEAGKETELLINSYGCDSIIETVTTFIPSDTNHIIQYTCDVLKIGIDTARYITKLCDSLIITDYRFKAGDTVEISQYTCDLSKTRKDTTWLKNRIGCDSIIYSDIQYRPLKLEYAIDSIGCYNEKNGKIRILNSIDFKEPYELYVNGTNYNNENEITNLASGRYEIYIKDQRSCYRDSVKIEFVNPEELKTELGQDKEIESGTRVKVNLQTNKTLVNIYWTPKNISNCINCNEIEILIDQDTWIYSQGIDEHGCISLDSIYIRIKKSKKVYAPNVISPNGDQINDYFFIQGEEGSIVKTLVIYDRWGEKIFEAINRPINSPNSGWDGTFHSKELTPGVYVYYALVLTEGKNNEIFGEITLLK